MLIFSVHLKLESVHKFTRESNGAVRVLDCCVDEFYYRILCLVLIVPQGIKIMMLHMHRGYTLKRHFPFFGEEGIPEHKKNAIRFEEKAYIAATSQSDYKGKIFSGMLNLERESQNSNFNAASYSQNPQYPAAGMDAGDWRIQLPAVSRQRIVNKIIDTLGRHLPFSELDDMRELMKIAMRFEGKQFASATSQSDYLRRISLKMMLLETRSPNPTANSIQFNAAVY